MRNTSNSSKGQFIIISAVVIISVFYLVSRWMEPYTIPDTSRIVLIDEYFVFDNIEKEALDTVNSSTSCDDLVNNLDEFERYMEDYAFKKLIVYFDYTLETPCYQYDPEFPILVIFDIQIESEDTKLTSTFYGFWPEESAPS